MSLSLGNLYCLRLVTSYDIELGLNGYMWRIVAAQLTIVLMNCVSTVTYRIKVNGELTEEISPQHGLRQGDPIFPTFSCYVLRRFPACYMKLKGEGS